MIAWWSSAQRSPEKLDDSAAQLKSQKPARQDGTVQRVDGRAGELQATIETGLKGSGGDIKCDGGYVWINRTGSSGIAGC